MFARVVVALYRYIIYDNVLYSLYDDNIYYVPRYVNIVRVAELHY